jgi:hypothetical protein
MVLVSLISVLAAPAARAESARDIRRVTEGALLFRTAGALLDSSRSGAADDEGRRAVVELAVAHHLVSKYTSLVAVEVTPARPEAEALHGHALATNLPDGWDYTAVFGLGQGATQSPVHVALGLAALLLAGALGAFALRTSRA